MAVAAAVVAPTYLPITDSDAVRFLECLQSGEKRKPPEQHRSSRRLATPTAHRPGLPTCPSSCPSGADTANAPPPAQQGSAKIADRARGAETGRERGKAWRHGTLPPDPRLVGLVGFFLAFFARSSAYAGACRCECNGRNDNIFVLIISRGVCGQRKITSRSNEAKRNSCCCSPPTDRALPHQCSAHIDTHAARLRALFLSGLLFSESSSSSSS